MTDYLRKVNVATGAPFAGKPQGRSGYDVAP